ncbi:MAG: FAD-dependent oxidoreductase [Alphaproteobacteria bacterium]|nr:FAD-dependent oxidoreductase [Alphaproteobacteria bacterium]
MALEEPVLRDPAPASAAAKTIAVLGAGPAGLGAALNLSRAGKARVEVIEASPRVGGAAGGFDLEGVHCDFGSHRLHPAAEAHVLEDIREALGADLMWRPRHGRIRLMGKWVHFPLKPVDLALNAPKPFVAGVAMDSASKVVGARRAGADETFASVLEAGLGPTICQSFYFPYARKLWGVEPEALDPVAAHRRVSGSSIPKMIGKVLRQVPGFKSKTAGGFYYPRKGFKQISEGLRTSAEAYGARFTFNTRVTDVFTEDGRVTGVGLDGPEGKRTLPVGAAWSSLPITLLAKMMRPNAPQAVLDAAASIRYRAMILIYLVLEQDQFTEFDAHYFPETHIPMSRLSEPKNYSAANEPDGVTVLCAELPCAVTDDVWTMSDDALGEAMCGWLADTGLPVRAKVLRTVTHRLAQAYPIYDRDFAGKLDTLEQWLAGFEGLLTFGRQGLFAHDNTHHALAMAHAAERCLGADGVWDKQAWARARESFRDHVVED